MYIKDLDPLKTELKIGPKKIPSTRYKRGNSIDITSIDQYSYLEDLPEKVKAFVVKQAKPVLSNPMTF